MRGYVDGFVLAVPKKKLQDYKRLALKTGKIWKKHGALDYVEAVGNDPRAAPSRFLPTVTQTQRFSGGSVPKRLEDCPCMAYCVKDSYDFADWSPGLP